MTRLLATATAAALFMVISVHAASDGDRWTVEEIAGLASLSLRELGAPPADPTNRVADDPRAADLGRRLFADARLSANGQVSCRTCHDPEQTFQDGRPLGQGVGLTNRRTMPLAGTAHSPFLFWDGRKDSQWAQALGPLESPVEHGGTREQYAHVIADYYRADYEIVFGSLPSLTTREAVTIVFVNIGKALAAYERQIPVERSRFDRYIDALVQAGRAPAGVLTQDEVAGLRLFVGKAECTRCHNGPLLTNNEFHNTGVASRPGQHADTGRFSGADAVLRDEFNCRSRWSDARDSCRELEFLITHDRTLEAAFKVPSLRNVAARAPYMHAGQMATLHEVLDHYNRAPRAQAGRSELQPLHLSGQERRQLEAFLGTLSAER